MPNLSNREMMEESVSAFETGQFVPYYQPIYNQDAKTLVGAEALARWVSPKYGFLAPAEFVPVFEDNGIITKLDIHIYEQVCEFQRSCLDRGVPTVPISVNFSRYDIYQENFVEKVEEIRRKYDIPTKLLRIEITESAALSGIFAARTVIDQFHKYGYVVEMDDFGSGYSSLNVLKDLDFDILKLDMDFLCGDMRGKGGIIISSIVMMAKWLNVPVIAEGVETEYQASFITSVGVNNVQGYLYSMPLSAKTFEEKLVSGVMAELKPQMKLIDSIDGSRFWDPQSLETMVFNNYVGGACIFQYNRNGDLQMLRVNKKYLKELGMNLKESDLVLNNAWNLVDDKNRAIFVDTLEKAIESEEAECDTWVTVRSECCGDEVMCIRSTVKMIGRGENEFIFYSTIRNITREKTLIQELSVSEERFKAASEQAKIYYWEYNISTKEMFPCFRCMRDLGLPSVVKNYPEPVIESGLIPADYADMYREMMKKTEAGEPSLEALIPLTADRIPHMVRYTVEFDENGRPVKAYGSATPV